MLSKNRPSLPVFIFLIGAIYIFAWRELEDVTNYNNQDAITANISVNQYERMIYQDLIYILANISSLPPPAAASSSCSPPVLPSTPDCSGQTGLTGEIMKHPRRVALMILFGFEVDTLEIALREQHQMVDKVFLVESTKTHKGVGLTRLVSTSFLLIKGSMSS